MMLQAGKMCVSCSGKVVQGKELRAANGAVDPKLLFEPLEDWYFDDLRHASSNRVSRSQHCWNVGLCCMKLWSKRSVSNVYGCFIRLGPST